MMYAQFCTRPDIAFVVGLLGRYLSNLGKDYWTTVKKGLRYLKGTKNCMLTYKRVENLELIGYTDCDFASCIDDNIYIRLYLYISLWCRVLEINISDFFYNASRIRGMFWCNHTGCLVEKFDL